MMGFLSWKNSGIIAVVAFAIFIAYPHRELDLDGTVIPMVAKYSCKEGSEIPSNLLLNETVILITGATSGIGLSLTRYICSNFGATVIALGRSEEKLQSLRNEFPSNIKTFQVDQSDLASVSRVADEIRQSVEKINILVNNAGMMYGYISQMFAEKEYFESKTTGLDKSLVTNYLSHFLITEKLASLLKPHSRCGTPPRVIQISSVLHWSVDGTELLPHLDVDGTRSPPLAANPGAYHGLALWRGQQAYSNSKLAQIYHARALSKLNRNSKLSGVQIRCVCPHGVSTNIGSADSLLELLFKVTYPVDGWGISSPLHAMFGFFDNFPESDFIGNANVNPLSLLPTLSFGIPLFQDILGSLLCLALYVFQKLTPNSGPQRTSLYSHNFTIMNELYDWSLQTIAEYL